MSNNTVNSSIGPVRGHRHSVDTPSCSPSVLPGPRAPSPIVAFHGIRAAQTATERRYHISPDRFRSFLSWMRNWGYVSVTPDEFLSGTAAEKSVLVTFDDGYAELYPELLQCVAEFALKPLVFLVAGQIGGTNKWDEDRDVLPARLLGADQIRELATHGVQFGSHTMSHSWLPTLASAQLKYEIVDSKHRLEDLLQEPVKWFAYPFGSVDERVRAAVEDAGYSAAFGVAWGLSFDEDRYLLKRIGISEDDGGVSSFMKLRFGRYLIGEVLMHGQDKLAALKSDLVARFARD
ncbi:MAG: polysaccharide deacetylase family protein [Proteobacteria bacterium]|nr:polysaccharide deacetylase family protein [Pseudomonadota bacterium]